MDLPREWMPVELGLLLGGIVALGVTLQRQLMDWRIPASGESRPANPLRKRIHILLVVFALFVWLPPEWLFLNRWIWLTGFLIGWLVFPQHEFAALAWPDEADRQHGVRDTGIVAYPTVMFWATLVYSPGVSALLLCYLALGDGCASLYGASGSARLPWNRAKSWKGLLAFILASMAGAGLLLTAYIGTRWDAVAFEPPWQPLSQALVFAIVLGLVESLPTKLDDNLRIGLAFAVLWQCLAPAV